MAKIVLEQLNSKTKLMSSKASDEIEPIGVVSEKVSIIITINSSDTNESCR